MDMNGVSAVVTGGASGLGEGTARAFAAAGAKVTIFDLNDERGTLVAGEIGGQYVKVNVAEEDSVNAGLDAVEAAHGTPRILVNCAGIAVGEKTISKGVPHDLGRFAKIVHVNLVGTFNCISRTALRMAASDPVNDEERGVIINTASVAAFDGQIGQAAYSASKGGVVGMTLPIARDLSRDGIRVCTIAPGLFLTPMFQSLPQEAIDSLSAGVPFPQRLGSPAEYAKLAQSIVENPMLNGETIRLDGALRMAPR
ncbi:MAG: SDR family NAD(P)-dependent oxidoreductase [Pseudomonadota bacterium]